MRAPAQDKPGLKLAARCAAWREAAWPREHGSWSLAIEPLALALLAVPSRAGGWLALAVVAAFFARRPLRTAWREPRPERRRIALEALAGCALVALAATGLAIDSADGIAWLAWLLPSALMGAGFLAFDLRNSGREHFAEIAGAAAFALLPLALAKLAGAETLAAVALALVMLGRAVPTVMCVRALLRLRKYHELRRGPAFAAALIALGVALAFWREGLVPLAAVLALLFLAGRAGVLLGFPALALRARTVGILEAVLGVAFVLAVGATWPR
jgi:hypothetical protein